jgi:pyruvate,water dikinase
MAASPGHYAGRAAVVSGDCFDGIEDGAVLVCRRAPASATLLFRIGALVVDAGGALANAATIAREAGIPAVAGTLTATQVIVDGDHVAVDGTRGTATVLSRAQDHEPGSRAVWEAA